MASTQERFQKAMDDDFNTAGALGHLFDLVRAINQARAAGVDAPPLNEAQSLLRELTGVLGLRLDRSSRTSTQADPFVDLLLEIRNELRRQKNWALADRIRDRMAQLGVVLEDSKGGSTWHYK
jgi:cysteinyl-tRNA synthetase